MPQDDNGRRLMQERLRAFRKAQGWSQQAMAVKLKVAVASVHRWETGKTSPSALAREQLNRLGFTTSREPANRFTQTIGDP